MHNVPSKANGLMYSKNRTEIKKMELNMQIYWR